MVHGAGTATREVARDVGETRGVLGVVTGAIAAVNTDGGGLGLSALSGNTDAVAEGSHL